MYQYYVVEIQTYANGTFGHIVHYVYDEDADKARLKGEAKFHEILSFAAVSELPCHSAIMFSTEGFPIMHQAYKHDVPPQPEPQPEPEPEPIVEETPAEPEGEGNGEELPDVNSLFN